MAAAAAGPVAAGPDDPVDIPDAALRQCFEKELDKEAGETITEDDMASLDHLNCDDRRTGRVADLSGLEFAHNLETLTMVGHRSFSDLSPLAELTSLTALWLGGNVISDVSPLAGLTSLTQLDIGSNALDDISDLRRLTSLTYLGLYSNDIDDLSALRGMTALHDMRLGHNRIADISDLAANDGIGDGDYLELQSNPLNGDAYARHIPALQERGVTVHFDPQADPVEMSDRALLGCLEDALDKDAGETITETELASLTRLSCQDAGVADLSGLEEATALTRLDLDGNEIDDLRPLGELAELRDLRLRDNEIEDIRDLANNTGFGDSDYIDLRGNPLNASARDRHIPTLEGRGVTVDFDPPSSPVTISDAALRDCVEQELRKGTGVEITEDEMSTLDRLSCHVYILPDGTPDRVRSPHGAVASLSGLEFATNLEELRLRNNAVNDLSPLAELDSLSVLTLDNNRVRNIAPLADLPLTELGLTGNDISDFTPLARLRSLRTLSLVASGISDLSPLAGLRSLNHLWLGGNTIEDVSPLARLTSLTQLDLSANAVEDVSSFGRLTSVTYLGLNSNAVVDVAALRTMTSLHDVRLHDNQIADISALAANDGLGRGDYLVLTANPLDGDAHATHIPALQERGVRVHFDPSTDPAVEIPDRALRRCVEDALDKERGAAITESEAASLTSLTCRNAGVADLSGLEHATALTKLELDGNEIEDVSPLGELEALLYLGLRDNAIEDIEALADNTAFSDRDYIDLRGNPLNDEAHERHIPTLQRRDVTVEFDPLSPPVEIPDAALRYCVEEVLDKDAGATITEEDMAALERLRCTGRILDDGSYDPDRSPHGAVADLTGLEFAANLVEAQLRNNAVADLSPLAELASLSVLVLDHNRVVDIRPIADLPLTQLGLTGNTISDFTPLALLTSLRQLWLIGSGVSDLSPLAWLTSLRELWLGGNAVKDVSPLAGLRSLTHLDLGANAVEDVSSLGELTSLTYLGLYSNAIADVSALRWMTSLGQAYLAHNRISDITALVANDGLGNDDYLELQGNPIACGAQAEHVKVLRDRGVTVYADEAELALPAFTAVPGDGLVELRWSRPAGCHVDGYEYRHGVGKSPDFGRWLTIDDGDATQRTVDDLANGQMHVFELRIVGANGRGPATRVYVTLADESNARVEIPDPALGAALAEALNAVAQSEQSGAAQDESNEDEEIAITRGQLATLADLDFGAKGIADLTGLEYAVNLRSLSLAGNAVGSLSPLVDLQMLATLDVRANGISDISALTEASFPSLEVLSLAANDLADISALGHLQGLTDLLLDGNAIVDVTALTGLDSLQRLWLNDNAIVDIAPLAANEGLGQGAVRQDGSSDYVDLRGNSLNADAVGVHAPQLRQRGAAILVDGDAELVPFFAQGGDSQRLGVLRIVNPTDEAGEASVTAIDDNGLRLGPVTLAIGARGAVHFDSDDLESGNAEAGLSAGVGMGAGDWRLELRSATPLGLFAYMLGANGLMTSMNGLAPEAYAKHRVSMFKAAGMASRLRVINPAAKVARVLIEGVDDAGETSSVAVSVPAGATQDFTAAALERGAGLGVMAGGLGDGVGDWRLTATSYDGVQVLYLLGNAGRWVNLSAEPSAGEAASDGSAHLPLFLSDAASQGARGQSVVRIVNRSAHSGSVAIRALDAQGRSYPAGALALAAGRTVEFNSTELEQGDAERGLTGLTTTDVGQSDWRLLLASDLDFRAYAYVQAQDGYFGSLNELVSGGARQTHEVPLFNAASQQSRASRLRLVNSTGQQANVRIRGLDDAGSPGAAVAQLAIPAGATRELTASELEAGGAEGVTGALGEGSGQWRLWVESDARIEVMNLVESAGGHLSNLSR